MSLDVAGLSVAQSRRLRETADALGCTLVRDGQRRFLLATDGGDLALESWIEIGRGVFLLGPGFTAEERRVVGALLRGAQP